MNVKRKRLLIAASVLLVIAITVVVVITQSPKWSRLSYEAVVQETVTRPDGEVCLIVQRTTEIYANPLNSLSISSDTVLCDANDAEIHLEDFQPGNTVKVTLKDSFIEETPFYYPTVYEIRAIKTVDGN